MINVRRALRRRRLKWKGYQGGVIPLRCRLGWHNWSPNLMRDYWLRICRNCVKHDEDRTRKP